MIPVTPEAARLIDLYAQFASRAQEGDQSFDPRDVTPALDQFGGPLSEQEARALDRCLLALEAQSQSMTTLLNCIATLVKAGLV